MSEMQIAPQGDNPQDEEKFDFSSPESVLIRVYADPQGGYDYPTWKGFSIEDETVIKSSDHTTGAAGYEQSYGGFLDLTIMNLVDCPGEGWWVVEDITADYLRGDGWETDDDMSFYCKGIRPATEEEKGLT